MEDHIKIWSMEVVPADTQHLDVWNFYKSKICHEEQKLPVSSEILLQKCWLRSLP